MILDAYNLIPVQYYLISVQYHVISVQYSVRFDRFHVLIGHNNIGRAESLESKSMDKLGSR